MRRRPRISCPTTSPGAVDEDRHRDRRACARRLRWSVVDASPDDDARAESAAHRVPRGLHAGADGRAGRRGTRDRPGQAEGDDADDGSGVRGGNGRVAHPRAVPRERARADRGLSLPCHLRVLLERAGAAIRPPPAGCVSQGLAPRGHALRALEEPHAVRRPHHRVDDRARGRRPARAQARRRRRLQPATGGHAAAASMRRFDTASTSCRPNRSRRSISPRIPRTTRASRRGCRRRRSRTRACRRCTRPRIRRSVDYVYFVRKPDCRSHFFTASAAEFDAYTREGLQC